MNPLCNACNSIRRSMGLALMVVFLSSGAISGCSSSNDNNADGTADGGLGAADPNAGIYPTPQNIAPFVGDDPRKLQFWDLTYSWSDDPDGGTGTCTKGNVQIMNDELQVIQTEAVCPANIGQVTPCNPQAGEDDQGSNVVASGAVQQSAKGCIRDGQGVANCSATPVPGPTDALTCQQAVEREDPLAAGAVWYQRLAGIPPGTSANYWWGKAFGAQGGEANTYGGTQMVYWGDSETAISVAASGGGEYSSEVQPIYMCNSPTADVTNTDDCGLSSLFGTCLKDGQNCRINNLTEDTGGFFNIYFKSAPAGGGFGNAEPPIDGSITLPNPMYIGYWSGLNTNNEKTEKNPTMLQIAQAGYNVIPIAFGRIRGTTVDLYDNNFNNRGYGVDINKSQFIADIKAAQANGAKVLLSFGGGSNDKKTWNPDLSQPAAAADNLVAFLAEHGMNGVDFDLEAGMPKDPDYLKTFITELRLKAAELSSSFPHGIIITGAPQLNNEGQFEWNRSALETASINGLLPSDACGKDRCFDALSIQNYNNSPTTTSVAYDDIYKQMSSKQNNGVTKIVIGVLATSDAGGGYIEPGTVKDGISTILSKSTASQFGGIMVWTASLDYTSTTSWSFITGLLPNSPATCKEFVTGCEATCGVDNYSDQTYMNTSCTQNNNAGVGHDMCSDGAELWKPTSGKLYISCKSG